MKGVSFIENNTSLNNNNNNILDINAIDDGFNVESCDNGNDSESRDRIINDWVDLLKKVNYMIDNNVLNKVDIKHDNEVEGLIKKINKDKPLIQIYIRNSYSNQQSLDLFLCLENDIKITLNRYEQYMLGKEIIPFKSSLYSQHNINLVYSPPIQHSKNTLHMKLNNAGQMINNNLNHIGNSLSNHISSAYGFIKNKIASKEVFLWERINYTGICLMNRQKRKLPLLLKKEMFHIYALSTGIIILNWNCVQMV